MDNNSSEIIFIDLIYYPVLTLGPGKRLGLWFQGCPIKCPGCISKYTWNASEIHQKKISGIFDAINKFDFKAVTISGGEPFAQPEALLILLKFFREKNISDILVYSGFEYEYLIKKFPETVRQISVLIDGKFEKNNNTESIWKGSENQKLHIINCSENLREVYIKYSLRKKDGKLQIIEHNQNFYVLGIPNQKDSEGIADELDKVMSGM